MVDYYGTIFTIEVTIFGITIAAILVFVQLVYTNFSHRETNSLLKNIWLWLFVLLTSINIILTAFGNYILSLPSHDLFKTINLHASLLNNQFFGLIPLALLIFSLLSFVFMIQRSVKSLNPLSFLSSYLKEISFKKLRGYVLREQGIYDPSFDVMRIRYFNPDKLDDSKIEREEQNLKTDLLEFERVKKEVANYANPFEPINEIAARSIKNLDSRTLKEVGEIYCQISQSFVEDIPINKNSGWTIDKLIDNKFAQVIRDNINELIEICWLRNYNAGVLALINVIKRISIGLIKNNRNNSSYTLIDQLKIIADDSLGRSKEVFQACINSLTEIGNTIIEKDDWNSAENVFRSLGWLGERVIEKLPYKDKPLMNDDSYQDEYGIILNGIFEFSSKIHEQNDPMIYFDALEVIIIGLSRKYKETPSTKQIIESLAVEIAMFGDKAAENGNASGTARSLWMLDDIHKTLVSNNYRLSAQSVLEMFVNLAIIAGANNDDMVGDNFLGEKFDDYAIEKVSAISESELVIRQVRKSYIDTISRHGLDHDKVFSFITRLGVKMGTNFGLMFDPQTGILYSDDDPRRK